MMSTRISPVDTGADRGRHAVADLCREVRQARLDRGISQLELGRAVAMSDTWVSRIERGLVVDVTLQQISLLLAAVGLQLSARAYPAGSPIRDEAHAALLERLHLRLHRSLRWTTEVPLPIPGDLRAWDAMIRHPDWRVGIEAETRPRDAQALKRRLSLKQRDGQVDAVVLLLIASRYNRAFLRADAEGFAALFPVPARRALKLLAAGAAPGGNAIVLL